MDQDEVGKRSAEKFANALGPNRTVIIDLSHNQLLHQIGEDQPKDANDALRLKMDFKHIITNHARWLD